MTDNFPPAPKPNVLERIASGMAEGICEGVTSPVTIVKGAIDKNPRAMLGGVLDGVGMVEVVGSPATFAGRTAFRESIGEKIQEKATDWLREQGVNVPHSMHKDGYDCLRKAFTAAHDDHTSKLTEHSPQLRAVLKQGTPGLY